MILIFLTVFIMEDSIVPSLRLSALGSDFTLLIEDPLTDVQFNPAKLGNLKGVSIYFKPEWTSYMGGGKVNAAILYPKALRNVCLGLLSSYSYAKYHTIYVENYGYAYSDTMLYFKSYPSANIFVALPLIKKGGFFGLKGTIKKPNWESTMGYRRMHFDTTYYNSDTSFHQDISHSFRQSADKTSLWSIRSGLYLPFENSAIGFIFAITHSEPVISKCDSSFRDYSHTNISHYDSIRTMDYYQNIDENSETYNENYDIWQYHLGFDWIKDIDHGRIRFFCQGELGIGEFSRQEILKHWDFSEHRFEYTSPDTSYSTVDTTIYEDTDEDISVIGDIIRDGEEIGIGFEKLIHSNTNLLIGLKICRTRNEIKETIPDTVRTIETDYRAIMPLGAEFFVTRKICIRGGISVSYTNHSAEEINTENAKVTDSYLEVHHSFGLGVNLTPHFHFDLYNHGYDMASIANWKLEVIYQF